MDHTYYVDGLGQLELIIANKQRRQQDKTAKIKICVSLLQPLAAPDILAPCRDPLSRHCRDGDGNILDSVTNDEYLNLTELRRLWRKEWMQVPTTMVQEVCFDLALPPRSDQNGDADGTTPVHWDSSMPSEGGIAVKTQEFMNLIVLLATTLKIREGGGGIQYSLRNEGSERMLASSVDQLGGILERLSVYRSGTSH